MTCRRAFEIDVAAFVVDPRDPAWDDFRAHYPRCADCAAEVSAWSALQASLAERHPEPGELLRWNDAPDALGREARDAIARHVDRCASCRDELRALGGFAGAVAAATRVAAAAGAPAAPVHHPSASRAGGRHGERHAFARDGSARSSAAARAHDARQPAAGRRGVARVLLHPAFAYAVLALVLVLPTVRAALDHDAGRAAFDAAGPRVAEQAPATAPQPITGGGAPRAAEPATSSDDRAQADLDDAHVDHTAPRLVRQAPFRPAPPPPPAPAPATQPAPQPQAEAPPAAKAAAPSDEARLARSERAAEASAPAAAGAALRDAAREDGGVRRRAPGDAGPGAAIRLLPGTSGAARTLVVTLPPGAATAGDLEVRITDPSGGRELRQRVARGPRAEAEVRVPLPAGFTAPVLRVEVYAAGEVPLLQGSIAP